MSQQVLTITKELAKQDQVVAVMPRLEYESFLRFSKTKKRASESEDKKNKSSQIVVKRSKSFKVPKEHEKFYNQVDKDLSMALREYKETGESYGPFDNVDDLKKSLES